MVISPSVLLHSLTTAMSVQDAGGVGRHGADLIFSTASRGVTGSLQDWLTITSSGNTTEPLCIVRAKLPF